MEILTASAVMFALIAFLDFFLGDDEMIQAMQNGHCSLMTEDGRMIQ